MSDEKYKILSLINSDDNKFTYEIHFISNTGPDKILNQDEITLMFYELFDSKGISSVTYDFPQLVGINKSKKIRFIIKLEYMKKFNLNLIDVINNNLYLFRGGFIMNGYNILREKILFPFTKSKMNLSDIKVGYIEAYTNDFQCIDPANVNDSYHIKKTNNVFEIRINTINKINCTLKYVWYDSNPAEDLLSHSGK
jgi:hypothetical protein